MKPIMKLLGPISFYIGLVISLVAAFVTPSGWIFLGLAVLGIIVGLLNITVTETAPFLFASIAFIVAALGMATLVPLAGVALRAELLGLAANVTVFIGSGVMVIALRAIYGLAKEK